MKLIHLSDLHLGKRIYEYSMLEEQDYILQQILQIVDAEQPDGLILAGDIYDKPIPPAEAVQLFDAFLVQLAERKLEVYVISGNHDSPERIAFGARLMDRSGIHLSPVYCGEVVPFSWEDEFGTVRIYLLPFLKPAQIRRYFGDGISSYTEAVSAAISNMEIDPDERNVLVTHQFVTGAARTEHRLGADPVLRHAPEILLFRSKGSKVPDRGGTAGEGAGSLPDRSAHPEA